MKTRKVLDPDYKFKLFVEGEEDDSAAGGSEDRGDDIDFDAELGEEEEVEEKEEASEEASGEAEGEESEDDDAEPEPENRVPLSRFNQVNQKLKQAMAELESVKQAQATTAKQDEGPSIDDQLEEALEKQAVAIEEGDKPALKAATKELNQLQAQKLREEVLSEAKAGDTASIQEYEWKQQIAKVEQAYPVLNPEAKEYDDGKVDEVLDLQAGFEARGRTKTEALEKALKYVFPEGAPKAENKAGPKKGLGNKAKDAAKQPSDMDKAGEDADSKGDKASDVVNMGEEEFYALPESKKKSLRGDFM